MPLNGFSAPHSRRRSGDDSPRDGGVTGLVRLSRNASDGIASGGSFRHNKIRVTSIGSDPIEFPVDGKSSISRRHLNTVGRAVDRQDRGIGHRANQIWAPWRAQYIHESSRLPEPDDGCFLCRGLRLGRRPREPARLARPALGRLPQPLSLTIMAISWSPRASIGGRSASWRAGPDRADRGPATDRRRPRPDAQAAGLQHRPEPGQVGRGRPARHLHWHVVPRWDGDTNFMPVLGQTEGHRREPRRILRPVRRRTGREPDLSLGSDGPRRPIPTSRRIPRARPPRSGEVAAMLLWIDPGRLRPGRRRPRRPAREGRRRGRPGPRSSSSSASSPSPSSSSSSTCSPRARRSRRSRPSTSA